MGMEGKGFDVTTSWVYIHSLYRSGCVQSPGSPRHRSDPRKKTGKVLEIDQKVLESPGNHLWNSVRTLIDIGDNLRNIDCHLRCFCAYFEFIKQQHCLLSRIILYLLSRIAR